MNFNPIDKNRYELLFSTGVKVFFTHGQPVAGYIPTLGYIKTPYKGGLLNKTDRHMKKWLDGRDAKEIEQQELDNLISSSGMYREWYPGGDA